MRNGIPSLKYNEEQEAWLIRCGAVFTLLIAVAIGIIIGINQCRDNHPLAEFQHIGKDDKFEFNILSITSKELRLLREFAETEKVQLLKTHIGRTKSSTDIYEFLECGEPLPNYDEGRWVSIQQEILVDPCH